MGVITAEHAVLTAECLAAMNPEQIVKMGRELLARLSNGPEGGHGNIWPGNICFDAEGKAVLGEGSNAPVAERSPEQIEYMAPEAFWQNCVSPEADLYSVGLLMYTAYNHGCLPFTDTIRAEDKDRAQALRRRMKGEEIPALTEASEAVAAVIARALCFAPEQRYLSGEDMLAELSETDEALPSAPPEDDAPAVIEDSEAAAAAAAVGLAGVSAVAESRQTREQVRPEETAAGVSADSILMEQALHDMDGEDARTGKKEPALSAIFAEKTPAGKTAPAGAGPAGQKSGKKAKAAPKTTETAIKAGKAVPKEEKTVPEQTKTAPKSTDNAEADAGMTELLAQKLKEERARQTVQRTEKPAAAKTSDKKPAGAEKKPEPVKPTAAGKKTETKKTPAPASAAAKKKKKVGGTIIAIAAGLLVIAALVGVAVYSLGTFEEPTEEHISATVIPEPTAEATPEPTVEPTAEPTPKTSLYHMEAIACDSDWSEIEDLAVIASAEELEAAIAAAEEAGLENLWLGARWLSGEESPTREAGWFWSDGSELPDNSSFWAEGQPPAGEDGRLMLRHNAGTAGWKFYSVTEEQFRNGGSGAYSPLGYITSRTDMTVRTTPSASPSPSVTPVPDDSNRSAYTTYYYVPISGDSGAGQSSVVPTSAPTPAPTAAPAAYLAAESRENWSELSNLAVVGSRFSDAVGVLQSYNQSHSSAPLYNVWVGASYLDASEAPGGVAGWYWSDGSALDDDHWAEGEPTGYDGCKLMLRYVGGSWYYYAVADDAAAAMENTGYLAKNSVG